MRCPLPGAPTRRAPRARRVALPACTALLGLALAGCTGWLPHYQHGIAELPDDPVKAGFVYVKGAALPRGKTLYDCGPESLTAILQFWGKHCTVEEVAAKTYFKQKQGTLSLDLPIFARSKGLHAEILRGSLNRVRLHIDRGIPVILMIDVATLPIYSALISDPGSLWHFIVVTGYNDASHEVVCEQYDGRKLLISYPYLEKSWAKGGHYLLAAMPEERRF
ncbi:MAG: C39 family peptidase [Planctomycetes bacterium]|nr:C39 family peptidase [Planctomycetota bacterium]